MPTKYRCGCVNCDSRCECSGECSRNTARPPGLEQGDWVAAVRLIGVALRSGRLDVAEALAAWLNDAADAEAVPDGGVA